MVNGWKSGPRNAAATCGHVEQLLVGNECGPVVERRRQGNARIGGSSFQALFVPPSHRADEDKTPNNSRARETDFRGHPALWMPAGICRFAGSSFALGNRSVGLLSTGAATSAR